MKTEKFKVTPLERAWILYDVGNSAFVLMIATLVPIFFNALAEAGGVSKVDYLAYWGYASSIVTVVTAILGPILGTLADTKGFKKPIFMLCLFVGVIGCCAMGLAGTWLAFLVIFYHCQDRLLRQSGVLRLHAGRCDHPGADGHGVLPRVCVGLYRQLRAFCGLSGAGAGQQCGGA